jgi:hypothetical protein
LNFAFIDAPWLGAGKLIKMQAHFAAFILIFLTNFLFFLGNTFLDYLYRQLTPYAIFRTSQPAPFTFRLPIFVS